MILRMMIKNFRTFVSFSVVEFWFPCWNSSFTLFIGISSFLSISYSFAIVLAWKFIFSFDILSLVDDRLYTRRSTVDLWRQDLLKEIRGHNNGCLYESWILNSAMEPNDDDDCWAYCACCYMNIILPDICCYQMTGVSSMQLKSTLMTEPWGNRCVIYFFEFKKFLKSVFHTLLGCLFDVVAIPLYKPTNDSLVA